MSKSRETTTVRRKKGEVTIYENLRQLQKESTRTPLVSACKGRKIRDAFVKEGPSTNQSPYKSQQWYFRQRKSKLILYIQDAVAFAAIELCDKSDNNFLSMRKKCSYFQSQSCLPYCLAQCGSLVEAEKGCHSEPASTFQTLLFTPNPAAKTR
jgi:hypothetical protein